MVMAAALNQTIVYSIISGNEQGSFAIDNVTGAITVVKPLDYENTTSYELRIQADSMQVARYNLRAASKSNTALVYIEILDENDHAPQFSKKLYLGGVSEDARMFASVLKVKTTDKDTGNYSSNRYKLIIPPITDSKEGFVIEFFSGVIKTAMLFKNMRRSYFKFEVVATDDYGKGLSSKADVIVSVVNQLDMQVIVSNVPPTIVEENIDALVSILERYVQDQIPGSAVVVESIGARRYGEGFSEEDYTQCDLMIYAIDPSTNRAISRNELYKFLDGKVLDINKQFQDYIGLGGRILEIRAPDVVANVKKQAQAVGYTEGALLALAIIIVLCCIPAILIVMVSYRQFKERQAECAKTARIQMAMPAGKSSAPAANNLYEELGDSTIRGKKSVLQEGDRQRLISDLASRAITAHKQSSIRGCLNNKLPKSSSNITFLSDVNPLITQNPLYMENTGQSTTNLAQTWRSKASPRRRLLKDSLSKMNSEGLHRAWTLPSRLAKRNMYNILESPVIMDPIQSRKKTARTESQTSEDGSSRLSVTESNSKLSVREQARQFEQNARQDTKVPKSWENKESHPVINNERCTDKNKIIQDHPSLSPPSSTRDQQTPFGHQPTTFPSILITPSQLPEDISPPPTRKPTPPLARKNVEVSQSFLTVEGEQINMDFIPDPPNVSPPSPPPPNEQPIPSTSSNRTSLACLPEESYTTPPPPPLSAPSLPPSFSPNLPTPPPPPPPQTLLTSSLSQNSLRSLTSSQLSSAREKLTPPPEVSQPDSGPRRELKGILKNLQNLADIEKSVANMYSQIDKSNTVSKQAPKPKSPVKSEAQNAESITPHEKLNGNLSCVLGELEKRFPSQSTAL